MVRLECWVVEEPEPEPEPEWEVEHGVADEVVAAYQLLTRHILAVTVSETATAWDAEGRQSEAHHESREGTTDTGGYAAAAGCEEEEEEVDAGRVVPRGAMLGLVVEAEGPSRIERERTREQSQSTRERQYLRGTATLYALWGEAAVVVLNRSPCFAGFATVAVPSHGEAEAGEAALQSVAAEGAVWLSVSVSTRREALWRIYRTRWT